MKKILTSLKELFFSFRLRLTFWFVLILAVILGGFSIFIYFRQEQVLHNEAENRLTAQISQLEDIYSAGFIPTHREFEVEEDGDEGGHYSGLSQEFSLLQNNDLLAILDTSGDFLQKSEYFSRSDLSNIYNFWVNQKQPNASFSAHIYAYGEDDHRNTLYNKEYLFIATPIQSVEGSTNIILLGTPIDGSRQLPTLAIILILVFFLTLLIAFGGGFWLASRAMQPVQTITRTAQTLSEHDLNKRLHINRRDEIGELAATFDKMLDRLQAAFERQRQFTANASHELRTPLTIIELETNRALEHPRTQKEYQQILQTIQSENEGMSRMVNELLTLARLDSGRVVMKQEKIDLSEIALEAVERLDTLAAVKQVDLRVENLNQSFVTADHNYLINVITNLIENALNYSNVPNPQVMISTGQETRKNHAWAWLSVTDNGQGISEEHLPHIFDRFYRVSESRSRDIEAASGSGLGLSIVQSIIQAMNGTIEVSSKIDEGTTFTIWLPRLE